MAALTADVKTFIVQALACFDTPSQVAEAVKAEFGLVVSRQQVEGYDPNKKAAVKLAARWVELFHATREQFRTDTAEIPIANKAFRLRALNRMAIEAEKRRNYPLAAQLMEQAAKESGGQYTNKQVVDHKSTDGSMSPKGFSQEDYAAAQAELGNKLDGMD